MCEIPNIKFKNYVWMMCEIKTKNWNYQNEECKMKSVETLAERRKHSGKQWCMKL